MEPEKMSIIVTGSIAFDYLMSFPGKFTEHLRPRLMATAGQDFGDYRRWLEAAGVDTSLVGEVQDKFTASFFCSTDVDGNQIASFYTGAMANAGELSFRTAGPCRLAIISPNDPAAMVQYAEE